MRRSWWIVVTGLWCASCARQVGAPAVAAVDPAPLVAPPEPAPAEREVLVVDDRDVEELRWLMDGEVFFVWSRRVGLYVPLVYHGEPSIRWAERNDGAIEVNGQVIGYDLTELSEEQRQALAQGQRGLEIVVARNVDRMSAALASAIEAVAGEEAAVLLSGRFDGGVALDGLARLGPRLVGLAVSFDRAEPGSVQQVDLGTLSNAHPRLRSLSITSNDRPAVSVQGLSSLQALGQLRTLVLTNTRVGDPELSELRGLAWLRVLGLGFTRVGDVGLAAARAFPQLRELDLADTATSDAGLAHLRGLSLLRTLDLSSTSVGDAGLAVFEGSTQFREIRLGGTQVGDAGLGALRGNSGLRVLYLGGTRIDDAGLSHLSGLRRLFAVYLGLDAIGDAGLASLRGLSVLRILELGGTRVSDAGLAELQGLVQLRVLHLGNTRVTDAGLPYLRGLAQLRQLSLGETDVTSAAVEDLRTNIPECGIDGFFR